MNQAIPEMSESFRTEHLTSLQNPRIKGLVKLRDRRHRDAEKRLLIEGYYELSMALECGLSVSELYLCPDLQRPGEGPLLEKMTSTGTRIFTVTRQIMEKVAYRQSPDAWLAVAPVPPLDLARLNPNPLSTVVVVEGVEKPGNIGAILRSADAAGVDAVIVCDVRTDLFNPNVVRASKGALFGLPVAQAENGEVIGWLREKGFRIVATTPSATLTPWETDLAGPVAIAVGTEKEGLSPLWLHEANIRVSIPMTGKVNSLNVAQAATLLMYEVLRQRRG